METVTAEEKESNGRSAKRPREEISEEVNPSPEPAPEKPDDNRQEEVKRARLSPTPILEQREVVVKATNDAAVSSSMEVVTTSENQLNDNQLPTVTINTVAQTSSVEVLSTTEDQLNNSEPPPVVINTTNIVPPEPTPIPFVDAKFDQSLLIFCDSFYDILHSLIQHYKYATIRILVYYHEVLKIYMEHMFQPHQKRYSYEWYQRMTQLLFGMLSNGADIIHRLEGMFAGHQVYPLYYCLHHCIEHLKQFDVVAASTQRETFEQKLKDHISDSLQVTDLYHHLQSLQTNQENQPIEKQLELLETIRQMIGKPELTADLYYIYRIRYQVVTSPQQDYILAFGRLVMHAFPNQSKRLQEMVAVLTQIALPESVAPANIFSPMPISKPAPKKLSLLHPPSVNTTDSSSTAAPKPIMELSVEKVVKDTTPIATSTAPPLPSEPVPFTPNAISPPAALEPVDNTSPVASLSVIEEDKNEILKNWLQVHLVNKTEERFNKMKYHLQEILKISLKLGKPELKECLQPFDAHLYEAGSLIAPTSNAALIELLMRIIPNFKVIYLFFNQLAIERQHLHQQLQQYQPPHVQHLVPQQPGPRLQHFTRIQQPPKFSQGPGMMVPTVPLPSRSLALPGSPNVPPMTVHQVEGPALTRICEEVIQENRLQLRGIEHQCLLALFTENNAIDRALIERYANHYRVSYSILASFVRKVMEKLSMGQPNSGTATTTATTTPVVASTRTLADTVQTSRVPAGKDSLQIKPPVVVATAPLKLTTPAVASSESKKREVIDLVDPIASVDSAAAAKVVAKKSSISNNASAAKVDQATKPTSKEGTTSPAGPPVTSVNQESVQSKPSQVEKDPVKATDVPSEKIPAVDSSNIKPSSPSLPSSEPPSVPAAAATTSNAATEGTLIVICMRDMMRGGKETKFRINSDRKLTKLIKTFCKNVPEVEVNQLTFEYQGRVFSGNDFGQRLSEFGFRDNDVVIVNRRSNITSNK